MKCLPATVTDDEFRFEFRLRDTEGVVSRIAFFDSSMTPMDNSTIIDTAGNYRDFFINTVKNGLNDDDDDDDDDGQERKVVGSFGKKSCVSTGVRKPGNTYASLTAMT